MSRLSISRRLASLLETAEQVDRQAVAVHRMKPAVRIHYDRWRAECDRVTAEIGGPAAVYAAWADDGVWSLPEPPRAVAEALGIAAAPIVTDDMTVRQLAEAWAAMIED